MIEMGLLVGIGLIVTACKLNWRWRLWMFSHPLLMDVLIFVFLTAIHWGSFTGVMVATFGALTCSLVLAAGRKLFGHQDARGYVPGMFSVAAKL